MGFYKEFAIDDKQSDSADKWMKAQSTKSAETFGAIGGRFSFVFTPTGLGMITTVRDSVLNEELNLTDFGSW